jgi:predicted O-linked N-acetylglucosamine transferase (SPINDLY family)
VLIYPEIGMDPMTARLATLRLAPVQCMAWGHPTTSGFPTIDYYLSSDLMEPANAPEHYTETLVRLPNLASYHSPSVESALELTREAVGARKGSVLYWCCQSLFKLGLMKGGSIFTYRGGSVQYCRKYNGEKRFRPIVMQL